MVMYKLLVPHDLILSLKNVYYGIDDLDNAFFLTPFYNQTI
jgi:hypothetical protein